MISNVLNVNIYILSISCLVNAFTMSYTTRQSRNFTQLSEKYEKNEYMTINNINNLRKYQYILDVRINETKNNTAPDGYGYIYYNASK
jgi:hypothetical protein